MKTGRPLSGTSKREKISSYSSPYVAKAQEKALQRAREARKHLPRNGFTRNEWDSTPKSPGGVFDPSIRKKEIFRIEPRVPSENTVDNSIGNISFHSQDKPRPSSRMTVRTNVDAPLRRPPSGRAGPHQQRPRSSSPLVSLSPKGSPIRHRSPRSSRSQSPPPPPPPPHDRTSSSSTHRSTGSRVRIVPSSGDAQLDHHEQQVRQASQEKYSQLLRERLRSMLYQRIGLVDQVDEDGNTIPGSAAEHAATKTRKMMRSTSSYYKDSQAAMTSEMMKNMAHIMKAVGDLVANVNAAKDDHRRKKKIFNPSRNQPSPYVRPEHLGRDHMQGLQPPLVPQPSSSAPPQQPQNKDMVWEVSKAVTQANSKKIPLSKSGVIDLVLAKLQAIEQSEREMMLYLQAHQHSGLVAPLPSLPEIPSQSSPANTPPAHQITSSTIIAFTNRSNQAALDARKTKAITFPSLKRVADNNADIYDFMQDWREARKARETAFIRRNSSLASTVTTLSDIIYDRMLHSMAKDLEHVVDDYSQAFIKTV